MTGGPAQERRVAGAGGSTCVDRVDCVGRAYCVPCVHRVLCPPGVSTARPKPTESTDPALRAITIAPLDDEPYTAEERAADERARAEVRVGKVLTGAELRPRRS
jgi:hypothetical protein